MASGDGTSDGLGREEHTIEKSLGKATLDGNRTTAALESLSGAEKYQNRKTLSTQSVAQNLTPLSKDKQALQDSTYGHNNLDPNKQSSTSWPIESFQDGPRIFPSNEEECIIALGQPSSSSEKRLIQPLQEMDSQNVGPDAAQSNLKSVAPLGESSVQPDGGSLVLSDIDRAEPLVQRNGASPRAQSNAAASIVAPHPGGALVEPNATLIVAPPRIALVPPNGALVVAPPLVVVLNVNHGLNRSQLKSLRVCGIGAEGYFWPKLLRS